MRTLIVVLLLAATGCSTTSPVAVKKIQDRDKIGYVNALARLRGTQVIWVHPPEITVDSKASTTALASVTP